MKTGWVLTGSGDRALRLVRLDPDDRKPDVISPVLTVKDVRRRLRKSQRQVYRYLHASRLKPCARILGQWLFSPEEVSRFARTRLPGWLRPFFWDTPLAGLSVEAHRDFILARLLEFGDRASIRWIFHTYPAPAVVEFLNGRGAEVLSRRTWRFWALLLGLQATRGIRRPGWRGRARHWGGIA